MVPTRPASLDSFKVSAQRVPAPVEGQYLLVSAVPALNRLGWQAVA